MLKLQSTDVRIFASFHNERNECVTTHTYPSFVKSVRVRVHSLISFHTFPSFALRCSFVSFNFLDQRFRLGCLRPLNSLLIDIVSPSVIMVVVASVVVVCVCCDAVCYVMSLL